MSAKRQRSAHHSGDDDDGKNLPAAERSSEDERITNELEFGGSIADSDTELSDGAEERKDAHNHHRCEPALLSVKDGSSQLFGEAESSGTDSEDALGGGEGDAASAPRTACHDFFGRAHYATRAFQTATSHVVHYLGNVLLPPSSPHPHPSPTPTPSERYPTIDFRLLGFLFSLPSAELELLLRLATRQKSHFSAHRVAEEYATWETRFTNRKGRVEDLLQRLARRHLSKSTSAKKKGDEPSIGEHRSQLQMAIRTQVELSQGCRDDSQAGISTAYSPRPLLYLEPPHEALTRPVASATTLSANPQDGGLPHHGVTYTASPAAQSILMSLRCCELLDLVHSVSDALGANGTSPTAANGGCASSAPGEGYLRSELALPSARADPQSDASRFGTRTRKSSLVAYLLRHIAATATAWEIQLGSVLRPSPSVRHLIRGIYRLFQVIVPCSDAERERGSTPWSTPALAENSTGTTAAAAAEHSSDRVFVPPRVVVAVLRRTSLPALSNPYLPCNALCSWRPPRAHPAAATGPPAEDPSVLAEQPPANNRLHHCLPPSLHFFRSPRELQLYLDAAELETRLLTAMETPTSVARKRGRCQKHIATAATLIDADLKAFAHEVQAGIDECRLLRRASHSDLCLPDLLEAQPTRYYHLVRFTALHRWLRSAEILVALLERHKQYPAAVEWLRKLVFSPLMEVHYIPEEESEGEDETFRFYGGRHCGALVHRLVVDLSHCNKTRGPLQALDVGEAFIRDCFCPAPCKSESWEGDSSVPAELLPDTTRRQFTRRCGLQIDRIAIERALSKLYKPPRRWCAPPMEISTYRTLRSPHSVIIHASREPKTGLWCRTNFLDGERGTSSVEGCALRWYIGGRGRRERGWTGMHCEGSWAALLFNVLFHDILCTDRVNAQDFVYISAFQSAPLDLGLPQFVGRRQSALIQRLSMLESLRRSEFIDYVVSNWHARDACGGGQMGTRTVSVTPTEASSTSLCYTSVFPLRDLASVVPIPALVRLFRTLLFGTFESPPAQTAALPPSPYEVKFSGFPDLVLWRTDPSGSIDTDSDLQLGSATAAPSPHGAGANFMLSEVKSPNDRLGEKQHVVIDLLLRCGFSVDLALVEELKQNEAAFAAPLRTSRRHFGAIPVPGSSRKRRRAEIVG